MAFDKSTIHKHFSNVERVVGKAHADHYEIVNIHGSTIAQVVFLRGNEMTIEVDNFPGEKQYYSSSIPCRALSDFSGDLKRVGIDLMKIEQKSTASLEPVTIEVPPLKVNGAPIENTTDGTGKNDFFYPEAVRAVTEENRASISFIQRKFRIGYNRAAYLLEAMETEGIVSVANSVGCRTVIGGANL